MNKFLIVILTWNFSKDIINKLKEYDREISFNSFAKI